MEKAGNEIKLCPLHPIHVHAIYGNVEMLATFKIKREEKTREKKEIVQRDGI